MRVLVVGPFGMRPRTTMRVRALPMSRALAARGHSVTMLLPPWQNPEDAGRQWTDDGLRVENVSLPPRVPGLFQAATVVRLTLRALALRPEVVHLFKPKAFSGLTHWLLAQLPRGYRPRLVVDADDWEGPGGWNELGDYTLVERRFFAWQEHWGLTHADAVTVASRTLESLVWSTGVPPHRVFYVPNGVVGTRGASEQLTAGEEPPGAACERGACVLLYTRFFEFPVSRVIDVLQLVRMRVPRAWLLVVGKGLFGEEEELFRLCSESGLSLARVSSHNTKKAPASEPRAWASGADVVYAGWAPPAALPAYFAEAAVAVYPFDDTLVNRAKCPVKLGDLLAAGVPVVAEAVGQNREYIRDGETGFLVKPGDTRSFADAVVQLLKDADLRGRIGLAAARDVQERFAWDELIDAVERAYGVRS